MNIGIDARFAVHSRRGIGNYTLNLITQLAKQDHENQYFLYIDDADVDGVLPKQENFRIRHLKAANYIIWEQYTLPLQAGKDRLDLLHCTGNTAPVILDDAIALVVSVMDVMYMKNSDELPKSSSLYQNLGRLYRRFIVPKALRRAAQTITISGFSKADILQHISFLSEDKICVTLLAADQRFTPIEDKLSVKQFLLERFAITGEYILALGALDPRKNTLRILRSFLALKGEKSIREKLVLVGLQRGQETELSLLINNSRYKQDILLIDFVSEEELVALYNGASIFVYPSLYEGFGLPPLEAMSCGTPVVTSNRTSIPEIVGDAAVLIDPLKDVELQEAIANLLDNHSLCNTLKERGLIQSGKFSWELLAKETINIYAAVFEKRILSR